MFTRVATYFTDYVIPFRRFYRLALRLQNTKSRMERLDCRRQEIQREMTRIYGRVGFCRTCGFCCRGDYNHFTVIDYMLRFFSAKPIRDYGVNLPELQPMHRAALRRINGFLQGIDEFESRRCSRRTSHSRCSDLTDRGCRFLPEDRPIRCVLWTCSALRRQLNDRELRKAFKLTKELCSICHQATRLISH